MDPTLSTVELTDDIILLPTPEQPAKRSAASAAAAPFRAISEMFIFQKFLFFAGCFHLHSRNNVTDTAKVLKSVVFFFRERAHFAKLLPR